MLSAFVLSNRSGEARGNGHVRVRGETGLAQGRRRRGKMRLQQLAETKLHWSQVIAIVNIYCNEFDAARRLSVAAALHRTIMSQITLKGNARTLLVQ